MQSWIPPLNFEESADIDKLITNIFQSKMSVMWAPYSYPTMKPVNIYFQDLLGLSVRP
jgi:hypothetical protein